MAGKLKGFDPKAIAVQHGEKIAFGVIVILVILGFVSTNWVPYDKDPNEITTAVSTARSQLDAAGWPEAEREEFDLPPQEQPDQVVLARLERDIDEKQYWLSQQLTKSIYELDKPLQRPNYRRVEDMIATSTRVFVQQLPEDEVLADGTEGETGDAGAEIADAGSTTEEFVPDEFLESSTGRLGSGGTGYEEYAMGAEPDYDSMYAPEIMGYPGGGSYEEMPSGADPYATGGDPYATGGDPYGEGMTRGPNLNGRGYSFVSVRGVFEYKEQMRDFAEATRKPLPEAMRKFEILDNEVERKVLLVAPDTWSDWQPVNTDVLRDVLSTAAGLAPDPVSAKVTDSVITCPLPQRIFGRWESQATHPRISEFVLSKEALEREMEYSRVLLTNVLKDQKLPEMELKRKGFSDLAFDVRQLQQGYMNLDSAYGSMMGMEDDYMEDYAATMGGGGFGGRYNPSQSGSGNAALDAYAKKLAAQMDLGEDEREAELEKWIIEQAKAEGSLILFRYIDFDVEPGRTYKYRVRVQLRNPNYNQPLAAAGGDPTVVTEAAHWTPWSDETPAVTVEDTVKYYLTRVEPPKVRLYPEAQMNVFQYDTELGTTVQQQIRVPLGSHIGGEAVAKQANPAKGTFEDEDYEFQSDDVLVDCLIDPQFNSREHPDLQLPRNSRGNAHINEMALVVTADHQFKILDPVKDADNEAAMMAYMKSQNEFFEHLAKTRPQVGALGDGSYADMYSDLYGDGMVGYEEMMGMSGGPNPLRRGSARGRSRGRGRGSYPGNYP